MTLVRPQNARNLKAEVFEETTKAAFVALLNDWFAAGDEKEVVAFEAEITTGTDYVAYILYTE